MRGLTIYGVVAFVSLVLSYGFILPDSLQVLSLLAIGGAMAGWALGEMAADNSVRRGWRIFWIVLSVCVLLLSAPGYVVLVSRAAPGLAVIFSLGVLILLAFGSISFLMPFSGVVVGTQKTVCSSEGTGDQEESDTT